MGTRLSEVTDLRPGPDRRQGSGHLPRPHPHLLAGLVGEGPPPHRRGARRRRDAAVPAQHPDGAHATSTTTARSSRPPTSTSPSSPATPMPTRGRATARSSPTRSTGPGTRTSPVSSSTFCQQALVEEGFFLHKYTPYGLPGSSWLPWVDSPRRRHAADPGGRDGPGALGALAALPDPPQPGLRRRPLHHAGRAGRGLDGHATSTSATGCIMPSWDLWEERWGVHAFTVGAVWGGLDAARSFADLFGDVAGLRALPRRGGPAARGDRHAPVQPRARSLRTPHRRRGRRDA